MSKHDPSLEKQVSTFAVGPGNGEELTFVERDRFLLPAVSNFYLDCKGITFTHELLQKLQ